jgi:hypothetical protein
MNTQLVGGRQRLVGAQVELVAGPRGGRLVGLAVLGAQEQHAARAVDHLGHRAHGVLARVHALLRRRQRLDEAQPLDAVVVLVAIEVLVDEHPQPAPQVAGRQQHHQHRGRPGDEHQLRDLAPGAAVEADQVAAARHQQQVHADDHHRGRVEHHVARDEHVQRPLRVALRGDRDQRHHQRHDQAARVPRRGLDALQQPRLRVDEQVVGEHQPGGDHQELERIAALAGRVAVDLLEQHQAQQRHQQPDAGQQPGRLRQRQAGVRQQRRGQHQRHGAEPGDVHRFRQRRRDAGGPGEPGEHEEPRAIAQELGQQHERHRQPALQHEHRRPQRGDAARGDQPHALRPALPADPQQQRQQQEADCGETVGDGAE